MQASWLGYDARKWQSCRIIYNRRPAKKYSDWKWVLISNIKRKKNLEIISKNYEEKLKDRCI